MRATRVLALLLSVFALLTSSLAAAPVAYIFTGNIVGTLDGAAVSGPLTVTSLGDTDNVVLDGNVYRNTMLTTTFDLTGVGLFSLLNTHYVFDNQNFEGILGFGVNDIPVCCDIIQHRVTPVYLTYDLKSSIGPIAAPGNPSLGDWVDVPTSAGLFTVTEMTDNTFQAIVSSNVPEPGSMWLLAAGGAAIAVVRRKTRLS